MTPTPVIPWWGVRSTATPWHRHRYYPGEGYVQLPPHDTDTGTTLVRGTFNCHPMTPTPVLPWWGVRSTATPWHRHRSYPGEGYVQLPPHNAIASGDMTVFAPFRTQVGFHLWPHVDCQQIKMCFALSSLLRISISHASNLLRRRHQYYPGP